MRSKEEKIRIGVIGQGWVGKNIADHYEDLGFDVVRYSNEPQFMTFVGNGSVPGCADGRSEG